MIARRVLAAATAACIGMAIPQAASAEGEWPLDLGSYVDVSMVKIDDGHSLDYAKHLAGQWRKSQDFAVKQGWITKYEIWSNEYPREGEPDIYLVTWVPKLADAAESTKRDAAYKAYMQSTEAQLQTESGQRAEYRHLAGSMLMRSLTWVK